ncbi:regulatory protein [Pelistega indica]|uniref:Ferric uptake regulation protein n=1 Tax=Pelistega indica TaxID=1414851 RepID=V8FYH5_9BURK|nr:MULTISPECIES: Fur family transcriptional regulator [Pelistega]ETD68921.1 regulatory protein [Pelistega indica]
MQSLSPQSVQKSLSEAAALCDARGKRLTPIRAQVLALMLQDGRSLKAYELLSKIQAIMPNAKPATVYRALDFLAEEGFIHRLDAINGWTACQHIHQDHEGHEHHHDLLAVCTECGAVKEISAPDISKKLNALLNDVGFSPNTHETEIRATCSNCKKNHLSKNL